MSVTMSQLLGVQNDVVEDCRQQIRILNNFESRTRVSAELILRDGSRRIYRAKAVDKQSAIKEILTFVKAVEDNTNDSVVWRLKGEKTYQMGANYDVQPSLLKKAKDSFMKYFFDVE